jgi:hypothetical protein
MSLLGDDRGDLQFPAIHKLAGSGKAADYEWQAVCDGLFSI